MAFTLMPEPPIADWLVDLDEWMSNSPGFFIGRPLVLDLGAVQISEFAISHLLDQLARRHIRIMGLTNIDPASVSEKLPPVLTAGWSAGGERLQTKEPAAETAPVAEAASAAPPAPREPASLLLDTPVRSGQSINFPFGDVTVLGSVASGAEVIAGGSIHIYGALRGTAMAGSLGDERARIFCSRNEAELIAVNGYYQTAEDMPDELRSRPVQAWLDSSGLIIAALA